MQYMAIVLSYLLGSIPTGLWLGLAFRGVDIREHGSKNIGATNTLRVLGKTWGALALAGDMLKGLLPVLLFAPVSDWIHFPLACGVAAILGHTFSVFLRFRGGKGVATGTGVFLALCPKPTLIAAVVFAAVFFTTRMVSAGSISAAILLAAATWFFEPSLPVRIAATLIAILVVWKHRANIQRILSGTENRM